MPAGKGRLRSEPATEAGAFAGQHSDIGGMVQPFLNAGVEHLIIELAGGATPESITLAAKALGPAHLTPSSSRLL